MDFSILKPLFELREEVHAELGSPAAPDKASTDLMKRVGQRREQVLAAVAKTKPAKPLIHDILRAAAAPLPSITARKAVAGAAPAAKATGASSKSVKKPK